ncbi:PD40 domain-containing protein [Candidatus Deianiraea vastatrix]|uniref:Protein TolB n=1 Tax=Candidatus Deianiraea vastatrix TaxID=2163644 RepID=A0A5B8XDJ3_9RICK|nr:PD40 domain-containing protein [Candidatus Deianiraea vastatrix]QED23429.1 Protein TolB [Candidatus Deianiraea vastatrix]
MKIVFLIILVIFLPLKAMAFETIDIEKLYGNTIPVSISTIGQEQNTKLEKILNSVTDVISQDLQTTVDMEYKGLLNYTMDANILNLKKYNYDGIAYNINVNVFQMPSEADKYVIEVRVYDVKNESVLTEKKYAFKEDNIRKTSHIVTDISYFAMTGKIGYFQSKIVYSSSDVVKNKNSKKSIYIIDQDGYGEKLLLQGGILNSPIIDSKKNALMYIDMTTGEPFLKAVNIFTQEKISLDKVYPSLSGKKYTSSPSLCKNDNCLILTNLLEDGSSIIKLSSKGDESTIVNKSETINTSGSTSPDDQMLVFESNYEGRRNLYVSDISAIQMTKLLVGNDGIYAEPSWSPDGNWICFTKLRNGIFHIGIIRPDGTDEQILYSSYMLENPMWLPNSDGIIFVEKKSLSSKTTLVMIDLSGRIVRKIKTTTGATSPFMWIIK